MVLHRPAYAVVSPYPLVRQAVEQTVSDSIDGALLRYSGVSINEAVALLRALPHAVLLLDPSVRTDAPAATVVAEAVTGRLPVVVISADERAVTVRSCLNAGARAYVTLRTEPAQLVHVLRSLLRTPLKIAGATTDVNRNPANHLSRQEQRALALYASGLTLTQVANAMQVTPHTAKEYLDRVRRKSASAGYTARTKVELHQMARAVGLV